MGGTGRISQRQ
jgi:hypothetical protein